MDRLHSQSTQSSPFAGFSPQELLLLGMAQRLASIVIHYAVRDSIKYALGGWRKTASNVLRSRGGSCSSSTNLAVALGRAANLPCGSVVTWIELPHYFYNGIGPTVITSKERVSVHYHVGWVTLDQAANGGFTWRAIESDPSDQYELGVSLAHVSFPSTRVVDFDGGPMARIDTLLDKEPNLTPSVQDRFQFLRHVRTSNLSTTAAVEEAGKLFGAEQERLIKLTYKLMTECYPTDLVSAFGPRSAPRFLPKQEQEAYLGWLTQDAPRSSLGDPNQCALAYLLGLRDAESQEPALACKRAGISEGDFWRVADFHEHLLSFPSSTVMNLHLRFVIENAEIIRRAADLVPEFQLWLDSRYPTLALIHREEIKYNPQYPYTVYSFLLRRLMMDMPPVSRRVLGDFVQLVEQPSAPQPADEATLDRMLHQFVASRGMEIEPFFNLAPNGPVKPYGVLYDLWKAYYLPPEQGREISLRLIKAGIARRSTLPDIDWFIDLPVMISRL
ncbi:hypothetical protein FB45DRAFT_111396 [Roridomyces roridus]|uniref:Transglutaminase-like domain-containing protein n=1 Tax=Roridomyces roridus TaxID=1738132 RepID=A0AAD7BKX0_9AGAR|nr:hypothetical protein FB45DRAFT_111396 [Roridomyces roridus]